LGYINGFEDGKFFYSDSECNIYLNCRGVFNMKVVRIIFEREKLRLLKLKAKRTGVWFKALTNLDRVLIDLVIKVVDRVRSVKLATSLSAVVRKLEEALENRISP